MCWLQRNNVPSETSIYSPGKERIVNVQVKTRKIELPSRSSQAAVVIYQGRSDQRKVDMGARSAVAILLCCASLVVAQDQAKQNLCRTGGQPTPGADKDAMDWAIALSKRFRELHDPVVETYSLGVL